MTISNDIPSGSPDSAVTDSHPAPVALQVGNDDDSYSADDDDESFASAIPDPAQDSSSSSKRTKKHSHHHHSTPQRSPSIYSRASSHSRSYVNPATVGPGYVPRALALSRTPTLDDDTSNDNDDTCTTTSSLSSYAGSAVSQDEDNLSPSAYVTERLAAALNPQLLDRVVVVQAQTSGTINAKSLEIAELREEATQRMEELKKTFAEGLKIAKQVAKDLEWAHKHSK